MIMYIFCLYLHRNRFRYRQWFFSVLITGYSWTNHQERYGSTPFHTHYMAPKPLEGTIPPESQVHCLLFMKFTAATFFFLNELLTKRIHYDSFHCCWECSQNKNGRICFDAGVKSTCIYIMANLLYGEVRIMVASLMSHMVS